MITDAPAEEKSTVARRLLWSDATISDSDKHAQALFGVASFDGRVTLNNLFNTWRSAYPKVSGAWSDALADQLGRAAQWQFPALKWTAMPAVTDGHLVAPVVTRVRKIPSLGSLQFDVYFYPFNLMDATPVRGRMVRREDMLCKVLTPDGETAVNVTALLKELDEQRFNRVPFVDPSDRLVYIAHRSMLDQFVSRRVRTGNVSDLGELTLADVFAEQPEFKTMFSSTAAFVGIDGTLAEAKTSMERGRDCYDVFVTESGNNQEPVLGWLTDVIIAASEG